MDSNDPRRNSLRRIAQRRINQQSAAEPNPGARDTGMRPSKPPYEGPYGARPKPGVNINQAGQADLQALRERRNALRAAPVTQTLADGSTVTQSGGKQQDKINAIKANIAQARQSVQAMNQSPASDRQKGSLGNISQFQTPSKQGFFNATHKHGEPMKNLIAKLKARRKGPNPATLG